MARRVLVFPLPFQGHINPMLQLAGVLHGRGLAITVLHTRFNALDPAHHPEFAFAEVADDVPADVVAAGEVIDIILAMNANMQAPTSSVHGVLASVLPAACLIVDANLFGLHKAAAAVGLPTLVLRTGSAACFGCFLAYPMLHENGYLPPKASQLYAPVKELPPLRVRDLLHLGETNHDKMRQVLARAVESVRTSKGLVINTFEGLEPVELQRIRDELDTTVVLAIGPLHKLSSMSSTGSSLLQQDFGCIEWLDEQVVGSVLYVSFGSLASVNSKELSEVAWGLANSGHPFLWVVRRDFVRGLGGSDLPDGFELAVEGRGKVIQWAPQQEVLSHRAVGGFWTHNGWNSTLESISEGVPMICMPHFADQMMNARYVEGVWSVGFELEAELERGKIEKAIRKLMKEEESAEMRERANELKEKVAYCLESGGSSHITIDKLIELIKSP